MQSSMRQFALTAAGLVEQTEETWQEIEKRFRFLVDNAPILMWMSGPDKLCTYFNKPWLDFTGRSLESELGNGWAEGVHPHDLERCVGTYMRAFDRREEFRMEYRLRRYDGEYRWIFDIGVPLFSEDRSFTGYIGSCVDITDRKRAEAELENHRQHLKEQVREQTSQLEVANTQLQIDITERKRVEAALRESESRFRTFFDTVAVGTAELDASGHFVHVNQRLCEMTGYGREELLGMTAADLMHPEDRNRDKETLALHLRGDLPAYDTERRCVRKDGGVIWVQVTAAMARSAEGKLLRSARIVQDITERKRAEEAVLRSEKLASLGRMAATIAHEINNPLDAVMNLLFLAGSTKELPESARGLLEMADAELRRVAHITRQSLGFYRESNAPVLTSVGAVLQSSIDLQKSKIKAKHAIIEKQWREDIRISAVAGELRQVFSNLISNSLDAIDEQGTVKLRVSVGSRHVRIAVVDNGKGIPSGAQPRLFEPFFTTKETFGTGLGLWVSHQIIEKHGGRIRIRSNADGERRGTTVLVILPGLAVSSED